MRASGRRVETQQRRSDPGGTPGDNCKEPCNWRSRRRHLRSEKVEAIQRTCRRSKRPGDSRQHYAPCSYRRHIHRAGGRRVSRCAEKACRRRQDTKGRAHNLLRHWQRPESYRSDYRSAPKIECRQAGCGRSRGNDKMIKLAKVEFVVPSVLNKGQGEKKISLEASDLRDAFAKISEQMGDDFKRRVFDQNGKTRIVDRDVIEVTNLHRQHLYTDDDIGRVKVEAAAERLRRLNPTVEIEPVPTSVTKYTAGGIVKDFDIVIDALDSVDARYALNDACIKHNIPLIYAGAIGVTGSVCTILPNKSACLRCM